MKKSWKIFLKGLVNTDPIFVTNIILTIGIITIMLPALWNAYHDGIPNNQDRCPNEAGPGRGAILTVPDINTLVKDIYVYSDIANDRAARCAFFSFAQEKGIQRVYLQTACLYDSSRTALMDLISDCEDRHIQVTLLYGNANWTLTANHQAAVQRAAQAVELASQIQGSGKTAPDAVQFYVEPYRVDTWGTDLQGTSNQYLDLLTKLRTTLRGKLKLTVAIPFWFDGDMITRNGQTRPLSEWAIDATDSVVMMDYHDTASAILGSSSREIAYAGSQGKTMVLAVDTDCNVKSANITFCEAGEAVMERELMIARTTLEKQKGFGGFAMFDYEYWKALKP